MIEREHLVGTAHRPRLRHETRITLLSFLSGAPAVLTALILLWSGNFPSRIQWTLTVIIVLSWVGLSSGLRTRIISPLQTISNVLASLREGDFSIRIRGNRCGDVLDGVVTEVNALGDILREQRYGTLDATALLKKVMEETEVAMFTLDHHHVLRLINRAGERLLAQPAGRLIGRGAGELGLGPYLQGESSQILDVSFAGGTGRWELRRTEFRQAGQLHYLLVLSNLSRALREEERQAWKRLIRVMGHEINNSLTPIKSIAASLRDIVGRHPRPPDWEADLERGLGIIGNRGESLSRFMEAYARLAQLPPPRKQSLDVSAWIRRTVALETRLKVSIVPGRDAFLQADGDQLDQLLINLVRNAADAASSTAGIVRVGWTVGQPYLEVWVEDNGPGISNASNLFVPFFTTKARGSGIGLVLSRQIAEAHGGTLTLENRRDASGCRAVLRLPIQCRTTNSMQQDG